MTKKKLLEAKIDEFFLNYYDTGRKTKTYAKS